MRTGIAGALTGLTMMLAPEANAQEDAQAFQEQVRQQVTAEVAAQIGEPTVLFRLWSYNERDGGATFCGVAADFSRPSRGDRSNFVLSVSPTNERFFLWRTTVEAMGERGCGRQAGRTDLTHPEINGSLRELRIYEPPRAQTPRPDTSHIPMDRYGNILVTEADLASPRCAEGARYAVRIFARHERGVLETSGEPTSAFMDYDQPFGRCYNRMGQAIMQGLLARAGAVSDALWTQNELRRLLMRR